MVVAGPDVYLYHKEDTERYILTNLNIVSSFLFGLLSQCESSQCHRLCHRQTDLCECTLRGVCGYWLLVQSTAYVQGALFLSASLGTAWQAFPCTRSCMSKSGCWKLWDCSLKTHIENVALHFITNIVVSQIQ